MPMRTPILFKKLHCNLNSFQLRLSKQNGAIAMKKLLTIVALISVISLTPKTNFSQNNVLLEYCTGTWCQWCPCGHDIIDGILFNYPNTVVLGYHGAGSDPWQTYSAGIRGLFGFNAYPTGCIGRRSGVISRSAWNNQVVIQTSTIQPGVNIEVVNKSYDAGTRTLTATVRITANSDLTGDYYINYVMTENNLIYSQTGNSSCTGASDYDHDHVVKSMMNGDAGELISSGNWTSGTTVTRNINYVVPSSPQIADVNNADLNIFVYLQSSSISTASYVQQAIKTPVTGATGINNNNIIVDNYTLSQNYPNPFNPSTTFTFSVPKSGNVSLKFYDALGTEVATYVDGFINAGSYSVEFDGSKLASGVYFYKLQAGDFSATKKMVLSK